MTLEIARLVICPICYKHAHILLPIGITGPEFAFKRECHDQLSRGVQADGLTLIESGNIRQELALSQLPDEHLQVEGHFLWVIERWNQLKLRNDMNEPKIDFHAFLKRARRKKIPQRFFRTIDGIYGVGTHPENPEAKKVH